MLNQALGIIYFFGFSVAFYQAVQTYIALLSHDEKSIAEITGNKPLLLFLLSRVLLWPYYVCCYKTPLAYVSELFFNHYGEKGKTYSGTQGIKNFYNDIFKGAYYKRLKPKQKLIPLSENSSMYQQALSAGVIKKGELAYANVLFAKATPNSYLLSIGFCQSWRELSDQEISRYALYSCQLFNRKNFVAVVDTVQPGTSEALINSLE